MPQGLVPLIRSPASLRHLLFPVFIKRVKRHATSVERYFYYYSKQKKDYGKRLQCDPHY